MLMQLVINGTALAMPMADSSTTQQLSATMSDCGEHSKHHPALEQDSDAMSSDEMPQDASDEEDCCKHGGCACPCLHGAAAVFASSQYVHRAVAESRIVAAIGAPPRGRPDSPFRPPA